MVERARPEVLVVERDAENRRRIAVLLGEAGIDVTAVSDGAAALTAMAGGRFAVAIADAAAGLGAGGVGLGVVPFEHGDPRRFVGRVRDRLLDGSDGDDGEAERGIATAKLACLGQRQHAAQEAGASDLVASLAREIAETAAVGRLRH